MDVLTTNQAAKMLGVTPVRVRAMIASGRLRAQRHGPVWMIKPADLDLVRERKPGRPWGKNQAESK